MEGRAVTGDLLWIEYQNDKDNASDKVSRYGVYLRQNLAEFDGCDDPEWFAMSAWHVATREMTPGFVSFRPDLHGITLSRDEETGSLFATVHVPVPNSRDLWPTLGVTDTWRSSRIPWSEAPLYEAPAWRAERVAVLPLVDVRIAVNSAALPEPVGIKDTAELRRLATAALESLVGQIQHAAGPVVAQMRR